MTDEAKKHGYDVVVVSGDDDVSKQSNQIDDFIVKGVKAIVITPCDPKSIGQAIETQRRGARPRILLSSVMIGWKLAVSWLHRG